MNIFKRSLKATIILSVFLLALFSTQTASAVSRALAGYAWSDNIGWIQFDPLFGGVFMDDATGDLNGYAWSDNIGWVSFDASDATHPSAIINNISTCGSSCAVSGWARAIAADNNGWDGWIKMSDTAAPAYGVNLDTTTGNFSGYAWGSDVVGWISFNGAGYGVTISTSLPPTVDLKVNSSDNPPSVSAPANLTVSWTTTNASLLSSCSGTGQGWAGPKSTLGGNDSGGNLNNISAGTYTYSITCNKTAGGTISDSVTITITAPTPDFSLTSNNAILATINKGQGSPSVSNTTLIKVVPVNGYNETVSLSSNVSSVIPGATDNFSKTTLNSLEYSVGSAFGVSIPAATPTGLYVITVKGDGTTITGKTVNVNLNVEVYDINYCEPPWCP